MSTHNMFSREIKEYRYLFVVKSTISSTVAIFTLRIQTDRSNKQQTPQIYRIRVYTVWHSSRGWLGGAKVSCIFCHRGVQLILAYSWARPAILIAGKGREVMFLFLLFLHFHSCSSFFPVPLFHLFCYLFCFFSLSLGDDTK